MHCVQGAKRIQRRLKRTGKSRELDLYGGSGVEGSDGELPVLRHVARYEVMCWSRHVLGNVLESTYHPGLELAGISRMLRHRRYYCDTVKYDSSSRGGGTIELCCTNCLYGLKRRILICMVVNTFDVGWKSRCGETLSVASLLFISFFQD
jgi:hypothetical protein